MARIFLFQPLHRKPQIVPRRPSVLYFSFAVCCGRRTRKVENDDLNRRASAMSVELVRRRSSIDYDNLPVNRV